MICAALLPSVTDIVALLWSVLKGSWQFLGSVAVLSIFLLRRRRASKSFSFGLPFNLGSWTYDTTPSDRIVAWKLYVQLATRKAALPLDEKYDVVSEVHDSLSALFGTARELLLELPPHEFERETGIAPLVLRVMNDGLRPHLTQWQAHFKMWWAEAIKDTSYRGKSPQEVQQHYPHYGELVADLRRTNTELSKLADELLVIARARKQKGAHSVKVTPLPPTPESAPEPQPKADYRIESDGTALVLESERATLRGKGPKSQRGARLVFKTKHDVAAFMHASEDEGYTFEGKEFILDAR